MARRRPFMQIQEQEELLAKILLPQPVKSLAQWRCVCKLWDQVISSNSFIKAHVAHQKTSRGTNKYLLHNYADPPPSYESVNKHNVSDFQLSRKKSKDNCFEVYGICDGLLCLSGHDGLLHLDQYPVYLYNPIIRKGKKLIPPTRGFEPVCERIRCSSLCFGYLDNDYKVIKVDALPYMYWVCIYSLNDDSWNVRRVDINTRNDECFRILPYPKARLVNGAAYFLQGHQVVYFDICSPRFGKINLPLGICVVSDHIIMEEYRDSIAIIGSTFRYRPLYSYNGVGMIVLIQNGNSYFWETKFIIEARHNLRFEAMGGFMNSNELVIRMYTDWPPALRHREYFLYNVENGFQQQFRLTREGQEHEVHLRRINITMESLLLLSETTMPPTLWGWS